MSEVPKARTLVEVAAAVDLQPLSPTDDRYVNLSVGRGGPDELNELRLCLEDFDAAKNRFAKIAFTGHRGSGKSTELLRLERDVADRFTALHLYADEALLGDYDYTDLFLWLVDALVRQFAKDEIPLNPKLAEDVAGWFAEVTLKQTDQIKSEIALETESKAEAKTGLYWLSLGLLARLKSMVVGSIERRKEIRRDLQQDSYELIRRVNFLLDEAHRALAAAGRPANLLIVVDNLDRLPPDVSGPLFFDSGEKLKQPKAHVIYTVPIAPVLAPRNINTIFEHKFTLGMVKVRDAEGRPSAKALNALVEAVSERVEIPAIFSSKAVVRHLAEMSGGSIRDLMRLVQSAQLAARAADKGKIDKAAAERAVLKLRLDFERLLIPGQVYFPLLAQIHATKGECSPPGLDTDPDKLRNYRAFFSQFLFNGTVLEYNGGKVWYDVHPIVRQIEAFKALAHAQAEQEDEAAT